MESEIARAGEAGEFGLQGVQPICVFALYITEMSNLAFLLCSNVIISIKLCSPASLTFTFLCSRKDRESFFRFFFSSPHLILRHRYEFI